MHLSHPANRSTSSYAAMAADTSKLTDSQKLDFLVQKVVKIDDIMDKIQEMNCRVDNVSGVVETLQAKVIGMEDNYEG